ncbi:MAG: class I SAM-dependent methyltransferase [Verrucomicrobiota bacterium]|nr:class I SAM-dependent methyltransferase [Verrucomicrobiota bacterium]
MICKICKKECAHKYTLVGSRNGAPINSYNCKECYFNFCEKTEVNYETCDSNIIDFYKNSKDYIGRRHSAIFDFLELNFSFKNKKFLDIGSGIGYSLDTASKKGWMALGLEPGDMLAQYSQDELNVDVIRGFFDSSTTDEILSKYKTGADFILIDNVLEHIEEPIKFLEDVLSVLCDEGIVLVAVPPVDWLRLLLCKLKSIRNRVKSSQLNLFYDPEQHLNYFTRRSVQKLLDFVPELQLLKNRFHHSRILNSNLARFVNFETGYFFLRKTK